MLQKLWHFSVNATIYDSRSQALPRFALSTEHECSAFVEPVANSFWQSGYLGHPKQGITELSKVIQLAPNDETAAKVRDSMQAKLEMSKVELPGPTNAVVK